MKKPVVMTLHNYRLLCPSTTLFYNQTIYENSLNTYFPLDAIRKGVYRNSRVQTTALVVMTFVHKLLGTWRNKINKYIVLTDFAFSKFEHSTLRISRDQFVVKSNFVDDENSIPRERDNFFLFVGRLTEEKGIETLLRATQLLSFDLVIIGGGPLENIVKRYAAENSKITYLGFRDRTFILEQMGKCKALIFPSVWYEGFPMTILEAFSMATPVVASRLGSMAEVVNDQINGLHFAPGDEDDLAKKLCMLLHDKALAERLGNQARLTYLDKYTPSKNYQKLIDIYRQAINR
jgi:glycosyltransferase involved in cell wall biosynthesis